MAAGVLYPVAGLLPNPMLAGAVMAFSAVSVSRMAGGMGSGMMGWGSEETSEISHMLSQMSDLLQGQ